MRGDDLRMTTQIAIPPILKWIIAPHPGGPSTTSVSLLQNNGPGLQQRLQVRDRHRPGDEHRCDELRRLALHGVEKGEPDCRTT